MLNTRDHTSNTKLLQESTLVRSFPPVYESKCRDKKLKDNEKNDEIP